MTSPTPRKRILFLAEDLTLAQVVRLRVLAAALPAARYEVHFACARFDPQVFAGSDFVQHSLYTLPRAQAFGRLERGARIYGRALLARYVDEELRLFEEIRPDLVVGDLRFSLCVSAPRARIPYASLINAYWSRRARRDVFPMPDHPLVRLLGERRAAPGFQRALPHVLRHFAAPVNTLRVRHGLPPLGDLLDVLMSGDRVLFPDVPELTPLTALDPRERFLGPVHWSPPCGAEGPWQDARCHGGIYLTLGSSGKIDLLPRVLAGLAPLGLPLLVATAGRAAVREDAPRRFVAEFVPGALAARNARFVVCNGGSSTAYQALAEGRPVLGIASNLDQYLAMSAITAFGAGILLRAGGLRADDVTRAAQALMHDDAYTHAARACARLLNAPDSAQRFRDVVQELT